MTTGQRHQNQCKLNQTSGQQHQSQNQESAGQLGNDISLGISSQRPSGPQGDHRGGTTAGQRHQFSFRFMFLAQRLSSHHLRSSSTSSAQHAAKTKAASIVIVAVVVAVAASAAAAPTATTTTPLKTARWLQHNPAAATQPQPPQPPLPQQLQYTKPQWPLGRPPRGHQQQQQQQQLGNDIRFRIRQLRIGSTSRWPLGRPPRGQQRQQVGSDIRFRISQLRINIAGLRRLIQRQCCYQQLQRQR